MGTDHTQELSYPGSEDHDQYLVLLHTQPVSASSKPIIWQTWGHETTAWKESRLLANNHLCQDWESVTYASLDPWERDMAIHEATRLSPNVGLVVAEGETFMVSIALRGRSWRAWLKRSGGRIEF